MSRSNIKYILLFIVSVLSQTLVFDNIYFSSYINIFIYILFLLLLPIETNKFVVLGLSFILGLSIDIFNSTPGIHASATVLIGYLRPAILRLYAPREGYEPNKFPSIKNHGLNWFIKYSISIILIHHIFLFFVDAYGFSHFFYTMGKILISSVFSLIFIIIGHLLIMKE
ncbi:MAG TPA: hypothetical protein PKN32_07830 [Bacteroidales bacterium]|nr:hypothetical protein [Bacteroidales bacterium]